MCIRDRSNFDFPGNVRQLENLCHWLTVMAPAQVIEVKDLPPEVLGGPAATADALVGMEAAPVSLLSPMAAVPTAGADDHPPLVNGGMHAPPPTPMVAPADAAHDWEHALQAEAMALLEAGRTDVWDVLTRRFETRLIQTALASTRGRRIEAAHKLGIGRNTITRKIQELGME